MSDAPKDPRIDELIGQTLLALAGSGASAATMASFARKMPDIAAASFADSAPTMVPGREDLLASVAEQVRKELPSALAEALAKPAKKSVARVNVTVGDRRTNVAVDRDLLAELEAKAGSAKKAKQAIREAAAMAPPETANRSAWVANRVRLKLAGETAPVSALH